MRTISSAPLVLLFSAWTAAVSAQPSVSEFDAIKERIEANCYDCFGGTEAGLRSAVADLERLVDAGFSTVEARRLIADASREIALAHSDRGSDEQTRLLARHEETYRSLVIEYPQSLDILREYAFALDDTEVAERLVREVSAALAEAEYMLGTRLAAAADNESDQDVARDHMQRAYELATDADKVAYGRRYADYLAGFGDRDAAERLREDVESYRKAVGL